MGTDLQLPSLPAEIYHLANDCTASVLLVQEETTFVNHISRNDGFLFSHHQTYPSTIPCLPGDRLARTLDASFPQYLLAWTCSIKHSSTRSIEATHRLYWYKSSPTFLLCGYVTVSEDSHTMGRTTHNRQLEVTRPCGKQAVPPEVTETEERFISGSACPV